MNDYNVRLRCIFEDAHKNGVFNGVVGIYKGESVLYEAALGLSDISLNQNLSISSRFDLASVTKQFTTSAIMLLKSEGKLNIDDDISKYFPGIPYPGVTTRMLMNHTAGLPDEDWCVQFLEDTSKPITNDVLLDIVMSKPPASLFAPCQGWTYSNLAYELLAMIVEKVTNIGFEEFLADRIFKPAGMEETAVYHRYSGLSPLPNISNSYVWENDMWTLPEDSEQAKFTVPLEGVNGAGLVYSTVRDMRKWDTALREGKILSHSLQAEMREAVDCGEEREGKQYGFGWFIEKDGNVVRHSGGWPGYINHYYRNLKSGAVLVMLTNMQKDREALLAMLDEAILKLEEL